MRLLVKWIETRFGEPTPRWRRVREGMQDGGESFLTYVCFTLDRWHTHGTIKSAKSKLTRHALRAPRHAELRRVIERCDWLRAFDSRNA